MMSTHRGCMDPSSSVDLTPGVVIRMVVSSGARGKTACSKPRPLVRRVCNRRNGLFSIEVAEKEKEKEEAKAEFFAEQKQRLGDKYDEAAAEAGFGDYWAESPHELL